ncbi:DUF2971 domain-containing protein [Burkholderia pseudomallei]|uniref:DUF2971 domain-containing protein n=1 Tax=Burkholderia pseudomallei TaxID=28450 RepID=UPI0006A572F5|nr:DUF2971 domain-containing protein [Burkholderia pseudomallei]
MTANRKRLYRFRPLEILPTKTVVDELRARELYLGTLEQNNDPMDGTQDAYWEGDDVVWSNLIRHYSFCLLNAASFISVAGDSIPFGADQVTARATPDDWPDAPIRQIFQKFVSAVIADEKIRGLVSLLIEKKRLAKDELRLLLDTYTPRFLPLLASTLRQNGHADFLRGLDLNASTASLADFEASVKQADTRMLSALAGAAEQASRQMQLIGMYEHVRHFSEQGTAKRNLLTFLGGFPTLYLDACVKAIYDEYYIACFTERNDNESMWGHYASGHRGICLVFEFDERDGHLEMEMEEPALLELHRVQYSHHPPQVNVFESLGYLPMMTLQKHWLSFDERVSPLASTYSSPDYHSAYWQTYAATVSHKFPEWEREREYRAVKSAWFSGRKPSSDRLMHYKEKHLKGIIFGMRTPVDLQLQIMGALDASLSSAQKADFEFHHARYCTTKKVLEINRLDLVKFA